jgi:hypothetical protein
MKGTVLFSLLFLSLSASYGQKAPCDLKKSAWQTALSVEDGMVQYLVETSNCVGSEVCGQPRIILKHTFKKPLWFKINLRGFDCSNSQIETTFATGNKHIAPDEEFSVQQNWHSFKVVTEALNVEVSYEQPVVKHISFDKEDKTIKTYTNGNLVDQAVVEASNTPAVETVETAAKSVVAAASTPSVKTEKTAEKPVVAAASTPSVKTEKTVEKPVVAAASTPSVKTTKTAEKVVEKPTEKPIVVQAVEKKQRSQPQKTNTDEPKTTSIATTPDANTQIINPVRQRLNVLKTDILYPIALGYERHIAKNFSVVLNGFYLPSVSYGSARGKLGYLELTDASSGFSVEGRYYTSRTKARLNGLYVGGFYSVRSANVLMQKTEISANQTLDVVVTLPTGIGTMGLMVGKQKIRKKGFTTDMSFGVGYFEVFNIPQISSDATSTLSRLSSLSKYSKGIAPRLTLSLGYAF